MTITVGIDPRKASHTAVAIDNTEAVLDEFFASVWVRTYAALSYPDAGGRGH
jgi:hypothetical protein